MPAYDATDLPDRYYSNLVESALDEDRAACKECGELFPEDELIDNLCYKCS